MTKPTTTTISYATLTTVDEGGDINIKELSYGDIHMEPQTTKDRLFQLYRDCVFRIARGTHVDPMEDAKYTKELGENLEAACQTKP